MSEDTRASMEQQGYEVPLIEQLNGVPQDARQMIEITPYRHIHVPYGALCHRAAARIAELERALAAAEARERKSYLLLARWLDKDPIGGVMLKPQTRSHLDAILYAIHALAKGRT